jgi:hypothetical protein
MNMKKVCVRNWSQRVGMKIHQFLDGRPIPILEHAPHLPHVTFVFFKMRKFAPKESTFSQTKTSHRKQQSYKYHTQWMTSGDALRSGRLIWSNV